jgi:hypothetical protein
MSIANNLTIFYNNQLVNFPCNICGGRVDPDGLDFGLDEGPDTEPSFVCFSCAKYLRPDLIEIQRAGFEFARSGMWQGSGDTGKSVEGTRSSMPWWQDDKPAAPAELENAKTENEQLISDQSEEFVKNLVLSEIKNRWDAGVAGRAMPWGYVENAGMRKLEVFYNAHFQDRFGDLPTLRGEAPQAPPQMAKEDM